MGDPTKELVEQTLGSVIAVLDAGAATIGSANWQDHDQLVNALMDATTTLYLRTQPGSGVVQAGVIWPDFPGQIVNFGCFKGLVAPLVSRLDAIVRELEALPSSALSSQDAIDLANLRKRIDLYTAALASASSVGPDPVVWDRVTMPILLGYYPRDFAGAGISDPDVKSPPDLVRPYTLGFQVALAKAARQEAWQQFGRDLVAPLQAAIKWAIELPAKVVAGARSAGRLGGRVVMVAAAGAGVAAAVSLLTRKRG